MKKFAFLNLLVVLDLLLVACGKKMDSTTSSPFVKLTSKPEIGYPAPDFSLTTLGGTEFTLSELKGKPVFLNFWSVN